MEAENVALSRAGAAASGPGEEGVSGARLVPNTSSTGEQNKCGDHPANTATPA